MCDVLDDATNVSIFSNAPVLPGYLARINRITKRDEIENATFDLLTFRASCDARVLELGDVCTATGDDSEGGVFVVAQIRKTKPPLWVRAELQATVERPAATTPSGGWSGQNPATAQLLTLSGGVCAFGDPDATAAIIPAAAQMLNRVSDERDPKAPDTFAARRFTLFVPLLPGVNLEESDVVVVDDDNRFEIMTFYTSGTVGFAGYVAVVRKLD